MQLLVTRLNASQHTVTYAVILVFLQYDCFSFHNMLVKYVVYLWQVRCACLVVSVTPLLHASQHAVAYAAHLLLGFLLQGF
jgi:hypothetical protein